MFFALYLSSTVQDLPSGFFLYCQLDGQVTILLTMKVVVKSKKPF